jgi:hypothetical protein
MKAFPVYVIALSLCAFAQAPDTATPQTPSGPPAGLGGRGAPDPEPKPYDKVITKDAKSKTGVFTVHKVKNKTYYEIPASELGKDFLWVSQIARTTVGAGYGGQMAGNRVVRWERHDNRVLLRSVSYEIVADEKLPIAKAVHAANNDTIVMAFNIEAFGKNDAPVIDIDRLFTTDVPEFSARTRLRARAMDSSRSFLESVHPFPTNIEVEATQTYTSPTDPPTTGGGIPTPSPFGGAGMRPGSATVLMHYSMVKLPEKPMQPRLFDPRVGYFSVRQEDFGQDEHRAPHRTYITRWRLEKKDPNATLSEPVKPIVYYVDPATPTKWIPYVKAGIESWQPAFEAAGFKNGIIAKDPPTAAEDPDWSPEDVRYSVIRWLPSTIENAVGPHISDPRTGEVLNADVQMYHNVMNLARDWYFVQASPNDPSAQKLPLSDELMGKLIKYVIAHEIGHTLGFQHNMKASSMYPQEKVRDREWVHTMGHVATLMDYSRFNYVAQPEDKIDPADLIPKIGPYDKWATMWGYKPIPSAKSPDDEKKTLDEWAREQDTKPWLRFSTQGSFGSDPGENTEAVGDADAIRSTALGVKNLERVMSYLLPATTTKTGEPFDDLTEVYARVLGQWVLEMNHVAVIVGGMDSQQKNIGQEGVRFSLVSKDRQSSAVAFLNKNALQTPSMFIKPEILRRIEPSGELTRIKTAQMRILGTLLSNDRLSRLSEEEAIDGAKAYRAIDLLGDVRKGVFQELESPTIRVDAFRRNLQRGYIELLSEKLNGRGAVIDDARPLIRGELRGIGAQIAQVLPRVTDRETKLHLEDLRDQAAKALDPKFQPAVPATAFPIRFPSAEDTCWPDYAIR